MTPMHATTITLSRSFEPHVTKWLARGDVACVFSNKDLGHPDLGRTVCMSLKAEKVDALEAMDHVTAPDGSYGMGWRYTLDAIIARLEDVTWED